MFDIQLFGANDTVSSSNELKLVVEFYDGDNRTIAQDNPRNNITASEVNAIVDYMKTAQPLIGDKAGASIVGASSCRVIEKTITQLDLS